MLLTPYLILRGEFSAVLLFNVILTAFDHYGYEIALENCLLRQLWIIDDAELLRKYEFCMDSTRPKPLNELIKVELSFSLT